MIIVKNKNKYHFFKVTKTRRFIATFYSAKIHYKSDISLTSKSESSESSEKSVV